MAVWNLSEIPLAASLACVRSQAFADQKRQRFLFRVDHPLGQGAALEHGQDDVRGIGLARDVRPRTAMLRGSSVLV